MQLFGDAKMAKGAAAMKKGVATKKFVDFVDVAKDHIGQKVAVLCARYHYRGILSVVTKDCLVLANAASVEVSGPSSAEHPQTEDPINGSVTIKNDAIEILWQPNWLKAPLPGEK